MNLVLIGVMGCGKTTVGRMLAKRLGMRFVDMDTEIERENGTITGIFERLGEEAFRDLETAMAKRLAAEDGLVVSTGGGIVKRPENLAVFRRNGLIVFLDRPAVEILKTLRTDTRPLLKDHPERLHAILAERYPLYLAQCDRRIDASGTFRSTLARVISAWNHANRTAVNPQGTTHPPLK